MTRTTTRALRTGNVAFIQRSDASAIEVGEHDGDAPEAVGLVEEPELGDNRAAALLDRRHRQVQRVSDRRVRATLGHGGKHVALTIDGVCRASR